MRQSLCRATALALCDVMIWLQVGDAKQWGLGLRREVMTIDDGAQALRFSLHAIGGMLPGALAALIFPSCNDGEHPDPDSSQSQIPNAHLSPRRLGWIGGVLAGTLGVVHLLAADASLTKSLTNAWALLAGVLLCTSLERVKQHGAPWKDHAMLLAGSTLLATTMLGTSAGQVTRWVDLGGMMVQPSVILLPMVIVTYAQSVTPSSTLAVLLALVALALQPDGSLALVATLTLFATAAVKRSRAVANAAAAALGAYLFAVTNAADMSSVTLAFDVFAVPFRVASIVSTAVWVGCALLVLPAVVGYCLDRSNRAAYLAFAFVWIGMIFAAALGDRPPPVVGYGGSAIVGYFLALTTLPRPPNANNKGPVAHPPVVDDHPPTQVPHPRTSLVEAVSRSPTAILRN